MMSRLIRLAGAICCVTTCLGCFRPANKQGGGATGQLATKSTFGITYGNLCSPTGFFVLAKSQRGLVAIAFLGVKGGDALGTGEATYIAYPLGSPGSHPDSNRRAQEGTATVAGWWGFHPFVFQRGHYHLKIGALRLTYGFPTCLEFEDSTYEFAPTPWTRIEDVDPQAPFLRWFHRQGPSEPSLEIAPEALISPPK